MYTAPPSPDDEQDEPTEQEQADPSPELDHTASTTDANWTGDVPADD